MNDKQLNIVEILAERCKECTLYEGDTISLNILMFDRPLEGICFNNNVYFSADELNYIMQKLISKEQECNKLYIQLKADEEYHKEEENTLRKIIKNKEERNIELYKENNKLKQTLTEIKEIEEKAKKDICNNCAWRNTDSCDPEYYTCGELIKILQKIKEVLNGTNP